MKKTDKKIISIFLVLIILISQVMPLIVNAEEDEKVTLEEYLIANGVDENEDGKISEEEWKEVKNLKLNGWIISDLTGIEKAVNLTNLFLTDINPNLIDFSKLTNLSTLYIYWLNEKEIIDLDLTILKKLENLYIDGENINNINLTGLDKLDQTYIRSENCTLKFSNSVEYLYLDLRVKEAILDLTNKEWGNLWISTEKWDNIKLPEQAIVEYYEYPTENEFHCSLSSKDDIYIMENTTYELNVENIIAKDNSIVEIIKGEDSDKTNSFEILGKKVGETEITIIDAVGRKITKKVVVLEEEYEDNIEEDEDKEEKEEEKVEVDKTLENTGITAKFCEDDTRKILKSNGELWSLYNWEDEAEIIDINVKKYVSDHVYLNTFCDASVDLESILYKDGRLKVELDYCTETKYTDVIDVDNDVFLKSNGDLYAIRYSYVTEKFYKPEFITDNVKKIVGDFIVKNDNSLWFSYRGFGILEHKKDYKMIGTQGIKYQLYNFDFVDSSDIRWDYNYTDGTFKKGEKYDFDNKETYSYSLLLEDGKVYSYYYDKNYERKKDKLLLDNVSDIEGNIIIRTDGTIWAWDEYNKELRKIKASNPIPEKDEYIVSPTIKNKEVEDDIVISGLKVGQTAEDFLKENNFKEECTVKIFNSENKELASTDTIGTGTVVKLFDGEELVREFKAIIYGDIDGDGKIESIDALTLIKLINEKIELKDPVYLEAGKVSGEEKATAFDALTIVKALNGKAEISQSI